MAKDFKERIAYEVLILMGILLLLCVVTRIWPLLFLVIPGIIIAALRLLFLSAKKTATESGTAPISKEPARTETEQDVIRIAFGILQRRVTEQVISRYPDARWVWEASNAFERFTEEQALTIILNRANGFRKAVVRVRGLRFCCLAYESSDNVISEKPTPADDTGCDDDDVPEFESEPETGETVDYALIAFQWVEANLLILNSRCNDAIAAEQTTMLIPAYELPHPDSWPDVCAELIRSGFAEASALSEGIGVKLPK